jgi:hypothetical protein
MVMESAPSVVPLNQISFSIHQSFWRMTLEYPNTENKINNFFLLLTWIL